MSSYKRIQAQVQNQPGRWLVTGVAGFIGSNLLEQLLKLDQFVIGLDNFGTGQSLNLEQVQSLVTRQQWSRFEFIRGNIEDLEICRTVCRNADFVLHQAALGSVPLSFAEPLRCHETNVTGFLNLLLAAREAKVRRIVYASSCAVYGDDPGLPKKEDTVGRQISPYSASKLMNELYAGVLARAYSLQIIGLRYFNIFGPRQDPSGAYAAVIPKWIDAFLRGQPIHIYGDGETSRDFCFVSDVVQANLLAAMHSLDEAGHEIYNIGFGRKTTLNELFALINRLLHERDASIQQDQKPIYQDYRPGDIRHSLADISRAQARLGYTPESDVKAGLSAAIDWYRSNSG